MSVFPDLGYGLGLRKQHIPEITRRGSVAQWFEALTENYLGWPGHGLGFPFASLINIRRDYPIVLHGVSLSIGSTDPLDFNYLNRVKSLIAAVEPVWISDHLCWTASGNAHSHDLLPLPYTREALTHLEERIQRVQEHLGHRLILENVSSYIQFKDSEMSEWEFIRELVKTTDCGILLDVNNVYVSSQNHSFAAREFIAAMPTANIAQIHLAGFEDRGDILIDTHDQPVHDPVWELLHFTYKTHGIKPTMIEWDGNVPDLATLEQELGKAVSIGEKLVKTEEAAGFNLQCDH